MPGGDLGKRSNAKWSLTSVKSHVDSDDSAWSRSWIAGREDCVRGRGAWELCLGTRGAWKAVALLLSECI